MFMAQKSNSNLPGVSHAEAMDVVLNTCGRSASYMCAAADELAGRTSSAADHLRPKPTEATPRSAIFQYSL